MMASVAPSRRSAARRGLRAPRRRARDGRRSLRGSLRPRAARVRAVRRRAGDVLRGARSHRLLRSRAPQPVRGGPVSYGTRSRARSRCRGPRAPTRTRFGIRCARGGRALHSRHARLRPRAGAGSAAPVLATKTADANTHPLTLTPLPRGAAEGDPAVSASSPSRSCDS